MGNYKSKKREKIENREYFETTKIDEFEQRTAEIGKSVLLEWKNTRDEFTDREYDMKFFNSPLPQKKKELIPTINRYRKFITRVMSLEGGWKEKVVLIKDAPKEFVKLQKYFHLINPKTNKMRVYEMLLQVLKEFDEEEESLKGNDFLQCTRTLMFMFGCEILQNQHKKMSSMKISSSMKGFVLLYPYVDNFLDDKTMSIEEKKMKVKNFRKLILLGTRFEMKSQLDQNFLNCIVRIEKEYSREQNPILYFSMVKLLDFQVQSTKQILPNSKSEPEKQEKEEKSKLIDESSEIPEELTLDFIEFVSVMKSYHSVIASCYSSSHQWTPEFVKFLGSFGLTLQLTDDLQDVEEDYGNNQMTIFTYELKHGRTLDRVVAKFINWLIFGSWLEISFDQVITKKEEEIEGEIDHENPQNKKKKKIKKLSGRERAIRELFRNVLLMFAMFSIAKLPSHFFSKEFVEKELKKFCFLPLTFFRRILGAIGKLEKEEEMEEKKDENLVWDADLVEKFIFLDIPRNEEEGKIKVQYLFKKAIEILEGIEF